MRALLPEPVAGVDLIEAYAVDPPGDRPFVRCNMISTFDGAVAVEGRSGMLGGPGDRRVFQALRSLADVILVGAGTVRTERYGPVVLDDRLRERRKDRGLPPVPVIAVVTRSGNLDWSSPFFTQAETRPIVMTTRNRDAAAVERGERVADVVVAGDEQVDLSLALDHLQRLGHRSVLLEGGPGLNADMMQAGRLDELCLTLSPLLVGGSGPRVFAGPELVRPVPVRVVRLLEEDGFLFYRLALSPEADAP